MKSRLLSVLTLVFVGATALFAAGQGEQSQETTGQWGPDADGYLPPLPADQQVTIVFEGYNLASAGIGRDATLQMLENFEALYPNITVETKATGAQEIFTSVQASLVAGNPPDVAQLLLREWDLNVANLDPIDLRSIIDPSEIDEHLGGEYPMVPNGVQLTTREGRLQGFPYVFSTPTLFYNATLFEEAGLDPDDPPSTWREAEDAALAIADATGHGGLYIACIELDWCTQGMLYSAGASFLNESQTEIRFSTEEAREMYRQWAAMVESGAHVDLTGGDALAAFQAGQIGMYLQTSAVQGRLIAGAEEGGWELRASAQPAWGTRPVVPVPSGSSVAMLSRDPLKQRAAWELMKYLTSPEAYTIITRDIGYLPLRPTILEDPSYLADWENKHIIASNVEQLGNIRPTVAFPNNHLQIRGLFLDSLQEVLFFDGDVDEVFEEAGALAQELLDD